MCDTGNVNLEYKAFLNVYNFVITPSPQSLVLFCFVEWDSFYSFPLVSVYHSKQAAEISLWKLLYGLPPHMLVVSLRGGQAGNERLVLGREKPRLSIQHRRRSRSAACFPTLVVENVIQVSFGEGVEVFWTNRAVFLFVSDTPTAHTGPAGLHPGIFQVLPGWCQHIWSTTSLLTIFFHVCVSSSAIMEIM